MKYLLIVFIIGLVSFKSKEPSYYISIVRHTKGNDYYNTYSIIRAKDMKEAKEVVRLMISGNGWKIDKFCQNNPLVEKLDFSSATTITNIKRK